LFAQFFTEAQYKTADNQKDVPQAKTCNTPFLANWRDFEAFAHALDASPANPQQTYFY
jgi:hypothetical protein